MLDIHPSSSGLRAKLSRCLRRRRGLSGTRASVSAWSGCMARWSWRGCWIRAPSQGRSNDTWRRSGGILRPIEGMEAQPNGHTVRPRCGCVAVGIPAVRYVPSWVHAQVWHRLFAPQIQAAANVAMDFLKLWPVSDA